MGAVSSIGKPNTEANVNACADQEKLKHEVVNGLNEELPVRGPLGRVLSIAAEVTKSLVNFVLAIEAQTTFKIRFQSCRKLLNTYIPKCKHNNREGKSEKSGLEGGYKTALLSRFSKKRFTYLLDDSVSSRGPQRRSSSDMSQLVQLGLLSLF
jgi:hypothetical protein